jgi:ferrochelatase
MSEKVAVILLNLGGPESLETVEPFLFNLFRDPDIFKIPFGQKLFAKIISKLRAPKVVEQYKLIGGSSPINELTEKQRIALQKRLFQHTDSIDVYTAMRYWKPLTDEVVKKIEEKDYDQILLLPLYPHYSIVTVGSSVNEFFRFYKGDKSKVKVVDSYYNNPNYLQAISNRIDETLNKFPEEIRNEVFILFSAHGTPQSIIDKGDPYKEQILASVNGVMKIRGNSHKYGLSFQSKVGPVKWLEPSTENYIKELSENGFKYLLVVPISFVSDHLETLYELGIEYREVAEKSEVIQYEIMTGLNDSPLFIDTLENLVLEEL